MICAQFSKGLSSLLRVFNIASATFLICRIGVAVMGNIIYFFSGLRYFTMKLLNYSIRLIDVLEDFELYGHKTRAVIGFLFQS